MTYHDLMLVVFHPLWQGWNHLWCWCSIFCRMIGKAERSLLDVLTTTLMNLIIATTLVQYLRNEIAPRENRPWAASRQVCHWLYCYYYLLLFLCVILCRIRRSATLMRTLPLGRFLMQIVEEGVVKRESIIMVSHRASNPLWMQVS